MAQFTNLPDDCYQLIFDLLPILTLLSIGRVSRVWQRNQQLACRRRKTLILLQGPSPVNLLTNSHFQAVFIAHGIDQDGNQFNFNEYRIYNQLNLLFFDHNVVRFLANTFPNLDTLFVVHNNISSRTSIPLIDMLQLYSNQMVTLKMYFNYRGEKANVIYENFMQLFHTLNSMTTLKHVTLESQNPPSLFLQMSSEDLKFLTRIDEFYCFSPMMSPIWHDQLLILEQNDSVSQLKKIGLGQNHWVTKLMKLNEIYDPNKFVHWPLGTRFTHYPCPYFVQHRFHNFSLDNSSHFRKTIEYFPSLTSFTIHHFDSQSLANKINILSESNTTLIHVRIRVHLEGIDLFAQPFDACTIKPLESVKALDLELGFDAIEANLQAQIVPLVHTFPNLISIKITKTIGFHSLRQEILNFFRDLSVALGKDSLRTKYQTVSDFKLMSL